MTPISYWLFCLCFLSQWWAHCSADPRVSVHFCVVVLNLYIKRNHNATYLRSARRATPVKSFVRETIMQLISNQHKGQRQSKVLFIGQQVDFPFLPPHPPFHMFNAALWPITACPVLSAIQNERRLKFMLVFSCCSLSSSGNICIVAVKLLNSC